MNLRRGLPALLALFVACSSQTQNTGSPTGGGDSAGDGAAVDAWTPPPPVPVSVAVGSAHACVLMSDEAIKCWGSNGHGQLGRDLPPASSDADHLPEPEATVAVDTPIALVASWLQTCALHAGGKASCWGANDKGQLGNGKNALVYGLDQLAAELAPDAVQDTKGMKAFAMGQGHGCVVSNDKFVRCWGGNEFGQLGNNKLLDRRAPDSVKMAPGAVDVAAGAAHSCAAMGAGAAHCWGKGADGRLGNGADTDSPAPKEVKGLADAEKLVAGRAHTCALRAGGKVSCWGAGGKGQLGDGNGKSSNVPVEVSGLSGVTLLVAGSDHTCALSGEILQCWGSNDSGQLGASGGSGSSKPTAVAGISAVKTAAAGGGTTCALVIGDKLVCWGDNGSGQLGTGASGASSAAPVAIVFPGPVVVEPDAGPAEPTDGRTVQRRVTLDAGRGLGWVVVQGLRDGVDVIRAEARGRDGDQVAVGLFRACLGVRCPKGRSCVHGVCELAPQGGNLCEESPP